MFILENPIESGMIKFVESLYRKSINEILFRCKRSEKSSPVYVFHHIPKCGGTSLNYLLKQWFVLIKEYRSGLTGEYPERIDIKRLTSAHCLSGHFETEGYYLHQRYPELLTSEKYRIFTFVRDPLQVRLSLYRYEKKHYGLAGQSVEENLLSQSNYLANRFPVTIDTYKEIIDRYFFIGILEEVQDCINNLAKIIGKKTCPLPWHNKTSGGYFSDSDKISDAVIDEFKEKNRLDYMVYEYCLEKYKKFNVQGV